MQTIRATLGLTLFVTTFLAVAPGCGDESAVITNDTAGTDASTPAPLPAEGGTTGTPGQDASTSSDAAAASDGSTAGGDPAADGPLAIAERDAVATVASTGDSVAIHVAYPSNATATATATGPFPIVVIAHGFQLPPSQYYSYAKRLASFGYVALTVDFPSSLSGNDNPRQAKDLIGGIDWVKSDAALGPKADATKVGMSGHSLGGKLALLAATMDPRVKAVFVLDPVDGGPNGCNAPACVVVKQLLPTLAIPTGFIGETTDATGTFQACAPAADNFEAFYAKAKTPSLSVTALGANHMSFLDNVATCGFICSFCKAATAPNADVNAMARSFMTAFYERHLRGNAAYDAHLSGAVAKTRWIDTNKATITSK